MVFVSSQIPHENNNSCNKVSNLAAHEAVDKSVFLECEVAEKQGVRAIN